MPTILLVDEEFFVFTLAIMLRHLGHTCLEVSSLHEARQHLAEHPEITLVIAGNSLADGFGYQLIAEVQSRIRARQIGFIALSSDWAGIVADTARGICTQHGIAMLEKPKCFDDGSFQHVVAGELNRVIGS